MATLTLQYDARNSLLNTLVNAMLQAGAKVVEPKKEKILSGNEDVLSAYEKMFGKRKDNKYTDNEIFVFNSMRNIQPILERHED